MIAKDHPCTVSMAIWPVRATRMRSCALSSSWCCEPFEAMQLSWTLTHPITMQASQITWTLPKMLQVLIYSCKARHKPLCACVGHHEKASQIYPPPATRDAPFLQLQKKMAADSARDAKKASQIHVPSITGLHQRERESRPLKGINTVFNNLVILNLGGMCL